MSLAASERAKARRSLSKLVVELAAPPASLARSTTSASCSSTPAAYTGPEAAARTLDLFPLADDEDGEDGEGEDDEHDGDDEGAEEGDGGDDDEFANSEDDEDDALSAATATTGRRCSC